MDLLFQLGLHEFEMARTTSSDGVSTAIDLLQFV